MSSLPSTGLLTAQDIAEELGVPRHRVNYVLRARRRDVPPAILAAKTRLYLPGVVPMVRAIIHGMDARRSGFSLGDNNRKGGDR